MCSGAGKTWHSIARCGDRVLSGVENLQGSMGDGLSELIGQLATVADERRFVIAIHAAFQPHFAQHHPGPGCKVFVHGDDVAASW
jgi:hypothetical protein